MKRSHGARLGPAFKGTKVWVIATSSSRYSAAGIEPGDSVAELSGAAEHLGGPVWTAGTGRQSRYVFGVGGGEVQWVGVAKGKLASSAAKIKRGARVVLGG